MESTRQSFEKLSAVSAITNKDFSTATPLLLSLSNEEYAEIIRETSLPKDIFQYVESVRSSSARLQIIELVKENIFGESALLVPRLNDEDYFQVLHSAVLHGDAAWFLSLVGWQSFKSVYLTRLDDKGLSLFFYALLSKNKALISNVLTTLAALHVHGEEIIYPACNKVLVDSLSNAAHAVIEELLIELLSDDSSHVAALLLMRCMNSGISLHCFEHITAIKFAMAHDYKKLFVAYFLRGFALCSLICYMEPGSAVANFYLPLVDAFELLAIAAGSDPSHSRTIPLSDFGHDNMSVVNLLGEGHSRMFLKLPQRGGYNDPEIFTQLFPALQRLLQVQQAFWSRAEDLKLVHFIIKLVIGKQEQFKDCPGFVKFLSVLESLFSQLEMEFYSGKKSIFDCSFGGNSVAVPSKEVSLGVVAALHTFVLSVIQDMHKFKRASPVVRQASENGRLAFSVTKNYLRPVTVSSSCKKDEAMSAYSAANLSEFLLSSQELSSQQKTATSVAKGSNAFFNNLTFGDFLRGKCKPLAPQTK